MDLVPGNPKYWYSKSLLFRRLNMLEDEEQACLNAIRIDGKYTMAWYGRARALSQLGELEEALLCLEKCIELEPFNADMWYHRGTCESMLETYERAVRSFDRAIEINSDHARAWCGKGEALAARTTGRRRCCASNAPVPSSRRCRTRGTGEAGLLTEGRMRTHTCFEKAIETYPDFVDSGSTGDGPGDAGQRPEAVDSYGKAIEVEPRNPVAWYMKGVLLGRASGASWR